MTLLELTLKFDNVFDLTQILASARLLGIVVPDDYTVQKHIEMLSESGLYPGVEFASAVEAIAVDTTRARCGSCGGGAVR